MQIGLIEPHRDYLRFLWIRDGKLVTFRHRRVVFGLACSPFLLASVIDIVLNVALGKSKSSGNIGWSSNSVKKLKGAFYVDNCVTSVRTNAEKIIFKKEARKIMASGNFDLRGWEYTGCYFENKMSSVLGVQWDKTKDAILINPKGLEIEKPEKITKKFILSASHRLYDPIGFLCLVTLLPKLLLQE